MEKERTNETLSLKYIIVGYIRHWRYFLAAGLFSLIIAVMYLVFYPATYEVASKIRIQEDKSIGGSGIGLGEAAGLMKSFGLGAGGGGAINLDDEWAVFSSNQLLREVVYKLGLDVSYSKPYSFLNLYDGLPVKVMPDSILRSKIGDIISLKLEKKNGTVTVVIDDLGIQKQFSSFPFIIDLNEGSLTFLEIENVSNYKLDISVTPASWVAENLSEAIAIDDFSKTSNTLEFLLEDYDKTRGLDILNVLMSEFNKWSLKLKKADNEKSMAFLDGRLFGVLDQLSAVEQEIEQYKIKNKMTDVEYDLQFYADALKLLREKIVDLEVQNHLIGLLDSYVKDSKNSYSLIPSFTSSSGEQEGKGAISSYNEALLAYEKTKYTARGSNPLSEITETQLSKMRENAIVSIENTHKSIGFALDNLKKQESDIFAKMDNVPTYEREYLELRRQQEILQGVYLVLLQKKEEVALSNGKEQDRGLVIEQAYVKYKTIAPRKLYAALFVIIFTLFVPIVGLFIKDRLIDLGNAYKQSKGE